MLKGDKDDYRGSWEYETNLPIILNDTVYDYSSASVGTRVTIPGNIRVVLVLQLHKEGIAFFLCIVYKQMVL